MRDPRRLLLTLALLLPATPAMAASTCDEAAISLAERYGIVPEIPGTLGGAAPNVPAPQPPRVLSDGEIAREDSTSITRKASALLGDALDAASRGQEAECAAMVSEARAVLASPMPGTVDPE